MATYASTTNPFIEPNNGAGRGAKEVSSTKNAPGMARIQSKRERKRAKRKEQENMSLVPEQTSEVTIEGRKADVLACEKNPTSDATQTSSKVDQNNNLLKIDQDELSGTDEIVGNTLDLSDARELADQVAELSVNGDIGESTDPLHEKLANGYHNIHLGQVGDNKEERRSCSNEDEQSVHLDQSGDEDHPEPNDAKADDLAPMSKDSRQHQHIELIKKLRLQLHDLESYAYERGDLEQVPSSVLAERQTVILNSLKKKLPLNIDEDRLERLELEELKSQVDKEISELIDPLITQDHLLSQLKTQLTDLERYISHLHKKLGKDIDKRAMEGDCSCNMHGCSTPSHHTSSATFELLDGDQRPSTIMSNDTLPKTSRLIRGLMTQLICSDIKIQEAAKIEKDFCRYPGNSVQCLQRTTSRSSNNSTIKRPQYHDTAVWNMHIDRVSLATDSLANLFGIEPGCKTKPLEQIDESLVESVVRRQLVPALRDLLAYGLIDPNPITRPTYRSFLFDPYYLISSLTCLPGSQSNSQQEATSLPIDKIHVWNVIEDYFNSHNEPEFKTSSVRTLSQSFNIKPSMDGPIKVTSKQALLIAVDDMIERLSRCKPNGPESHFKLFVYIALNDRKLASWFRIIFKSKTVLRKFYHNFSFVNQPDKMEKFLQVIDVLNQIEFKLNTNFGMVDQFVSAF